MKYFKRPAYVLLLILCAALLLQSCAASRGCGCGNDLSRQYKHKRR